MCSQASGLLLAGQERPASLWDDSTKAAACPEAGPSPVLKDDDQPSDS